jgi:diguanylate cyclase (GGDEF)-like protein/PAS domain S-box-containing protein
MVETYFQPARSVADCDEPATALSLANAVFNCTQEAIVVTDAKGTVIAVNPAFSNITGYAAFDVVGKNMRLLQSGRQGRDFYRAMWAEVRQTGFWQGEIWNKRKDGDVYPALLTISSVRNRDGEASHFVGTSVDLSRIKRSELELDHMAHHDELTGLPNRRSLMTRLEVAIARAMRTGTSGAVIFFDLDRFKLVNDSLGHGAGDELLVLVTERLKNGLRSTDFIARFGGDEFILLLDKTTRRAANASAARVIDLLSQPFPLSSGQDVCVGASVGISIFPEDGTSPEDLLQNADSALYQAKHAGRATSRSYAPFMRQGANRRLTLEAMLRRALERSEFALNYQPLVSLTDGRIIGFEALIRWQDPERGTVSPADFLPVAEDAGLIIPIGSWVLREACAEMKALLDMGIEARSMAVNISPRQFRHPKFAAFVAAALRETGLPPRHLELEITESTLMAHDEATLSTLLELKALGVRLAVDDFGTGYSSLAYLKKLPVDKLKIDRAFITDIATDAASKAIVTAIVSLASSIGREVLAEGVETEAQREALLACGCKEAQGYLFARPVPPKCIPGLPGIKAKKTRRPPAKARPKARARLRA